MRDGENQTVPVRARLYHCDKCGLSIDRDLNAAINIQVAGVPRRR
ncbi:zinc ribbon domain-containing protein [Bifidobacterium longum]|nr:zinc ribbon domain-containing protein [Bifidobacterium longum]